MRALVASIILFLVCAGSAHAQRLEAFGRGSQPKNEEALLDDVAGEFNFVRVRFDTYFSGLVMALGRSIFPMRTLTSCEVCRG